MRIKPEYNFVQHCEKGLEPLDGMKKTHVVKGKAKRYGGSRPPRSLGNATGRDKPRGKGKVRLSKGAAAQALSEALRGL